MADTVVHFEIAAKNPAAQVKFYKELFGWDIVDHNMGDFTYHMVNNADGGIYQTQDGATRVILYIQVDDVGKYLDTVETRGCSRIMGPDAIPDIGTVGIFVDPSGIPVGLYKPQ